MSTSARVHHCGGHHIEGASCVRHPRVYFHSACLCSARVRKKQIRFFLRSDSASRRVRRPRFILSCQRPSQLSRSFVGTLESLTGSVYAHCVRVFRLRSSSFLCLTSFRFTGRIRQPNLRNPFPLVCPGTLNA